MKTFLACMYICASTVLILALSGAVFIYILDMTKIGSAIRDYILSKIISEKGESK